MKFSVKKFSIFLLVSFVLVFMRFFIIYIFPMHKFVVFKPFKEVIGIILLGLLLFLPSLVAISVGYGFTKKKFLPQAICFILAIVTCFFSYYYFFSVEFFGRFSYSETTLIENYLVLDNEDAMKNDVSHFPKKEEFENTQNAEYYYLYDSFNATINVVLTLSFDEETYLVEKQKVLDEFSENEQVLENGELKIVVYYYVAQDPYEETEFIDRNICLNDNEKTICYYVYEEWGF